MDVVRITRNLVAADVLEAMTNDAGRPLAEVRVDGGAAFAGDRGAGLDQPVRRTASRGRCGAGRRLRARPHAH